MRHPKTIDADYGRAFEELWFATLRQPWASLVLVPSEAGLSVAKIARGLAEIGREQQGHVIEVLTPNLEHLQASKELTERLKSARAHAAEGPQVLVALEPVIVRPAGVAAALAADAVLLCVKKGTTTLKNAKKTVEMIGRERVSACIFLES